MYIKRQKGRGECADFQTVFGFENVMLVISDFYIKNEKKVLSKVANVCRSGLQRWGFWMLRLNFWYSKVCA